MLRREGEQLWITITGFAYPDLLVDRNERRFAARCNLWTFAAKVRLAVSRLAPAGERYYDHTSVQQTAKYRELFEFLPARKCAC